MDSIKSIKEKLDKLDLLLGQLKTSHARVRQLKRSVYVLRELIKDENNIKSPYGPATPIARFSIQ